MSFRILVALDESPWAQAAAVTACEIASGSPQEVELVGVHVVHVAHLSGELIKDAAGLLGFEPVMVPEKVALIYERRGRALLDAFAARCEELDLRVSTVLDTGAQVGRLVHHSREADLVCIGGRGETERVYPGQGGGKLERFVRQANSAVLVCPDHPVDLSGITVGFDGTEGASQALQAVARLRALVPGETDLLYVRDGRRAPDHDPGPSGVAALAEQGVEATARQAEGEVHATLVAEARAAGHDVLAMGYRGRSWFSDLLLGRVTERLLGKVEIALLIAR